MSRTSGPNDLLVGVDRAVDVPLRDQIAEQLRQAIRDRRLRPGVRLPASRTLALDLGVSRGVVRKPLGSAIASSLLSRGPRPSRPG